ncbi:MAG TPA: glycosyltransferase family 2 protein [Pseudonocardiaceae bacterium]|jgi:dolichol-phosphate mannosyltransferase|nr:glycosyltransferase family 2 protein [Pseudonocardiaceae bacterium]
MVGPPFAISVVIPVRDEAQSVGSLVREVDRILSGDENSMYEIIVVDDGSLDGTFRDLRRLGEEIGSLRLVRLREPVGQSGAIWMGVRHARAHWIATLDGDGQNDPADIGKLWRIGRRHDIGGTPPLVIGCRTDRRGSARRRATSWILNRMSAIFLQHDIVDRGSGIKMFRRDDFLALPRFDHMHRFLPALFRMRNGKIISVSVNDRPRRHGRSHYGNVSRIIESVIDICGMFWLRSRFIEPDMCAEN